MKALTIMVVLATGGQALALTPLPECYGVGAEAGVGDYTTAWQGSGFVLYQSWTDEHRLFLDDCKGGRRLVMWPGKPKAGQTEWEPGEVLFDTVMAALEAKRHYSMGQIAGLASDIGAKTKLGKADYQSCGCQLYYGD